MAVMIVVRGGEWASGGEALDSRGVWYPAVSGTVNQTGRSDKDASTFGSQRQAQAALDDIRSMIDCDGVEFELREVDGPNEEITDDQIRALLHKAADADDLGMVQSCDRALRGVDSARIRCERAIADAAAKH